MRFIDQLSPQHEDYLASHLQALFDSPDAAEIARWRSRLRNVELAAGEVAAGAPAAAPGASTDAVTH